MSPEVQNRGISGPTKRTHVIQKFILKKIVLLKVIGSRSGGADMLRGSGGLESMFGEFRMVVGDYGV